MTLNVTLTRDDRQGVVARQQITLNEEITKVEEPTNPIPARGTFDLVADVVAEDPDSVGAVEFTITLCGLRQAGEPTTQEPTVRVREPTVAPVVTPGPTSTAVDPIAPVEAVEAVEPATETPSRAPASEDKAVRRSERLDPVPRVAEAAEASTPAAVARRDPDELKPIAKPPDDVVDEIESGPLPNTGGMALSYWLLPLAGLLLLAGLPVYRWVKRRG